MKCTDCGQRIRPVVAVDIDGTLGDYHGHFVKFAERYFGKIFPDGWDGVGEWEDHLGLTKSEYREAKLAYRQGGMKRTMPPNDGAIQLMDSLSQEDVEIWLTTTRPWMRLDSVDPDTREWLRRHGIPYHHLLYDEKKYRRLAEIVDKDRVVAVIDDLPQECQRASETFGFGVAIQCHNNFNTGVRWHTSEPLELAIEFAIGNIRGWWSKA